MYGECQSGLNTEFQPPLALQTGVDQEEDKKEVCNNNSFGHYTIIVCVRLEAVYCVLAQ